MVLITANFKFRNRSTCSKGPIKRAGKVCGGFPRPEVTEVWIPRDSIQILELYVLFKLTKVQEWCNKVTAKNFMSHFFMHYVGLFLLSRNLDYPFLEIPCLSVVYERGGMPLFCFGVHKKVMKLIPNLQW